MADLKQELHRKLQAARAALVSRLEDLSEYDLRRPMTPTGTNLLGLVKHLAGLEYGYLGESLGRPAPETMSWVEDRSIWEGYLARLPRPDPSRGRLLRALGRPGQTRGRLRAPPVAGNAFQRHSEQAAIMNEP